MRKSISFPLAVYNILTETLLNKIFKHQFVEMQLENIVQLGDQSWK